MLKTVKILVKPEFLPKYFYHTFQEQTKLFQFAFQFIGEFQFRFHNSHPVEIQIKWHLNAILNAQSGVGWKWLLWLHKKTRGSQLLHAIIEPYFIWFAFAYFRFWKKT